MSERVPAAKTNQQAQPEVYDADGQGAVEPAEELSPEARPAETGGPAGPEPTRYGDWERKGRCIDF